MGPLSRLKSIDSGKRKARLQRSINMVFPYNEELCNAMIEEDFAGYTTVFSMMRDVCESVISRKHVRDNSDAWMPYQTRPSLAPLDNFGAIAWIRCQPGEVVGNISNWNAPAFTVLSSPSCVFAAGNRAPLQPSKIALRTTKVMARDDRIFDSEAMFMVAEDPDEAAVFSHQPWNHLALILSTSLANMRIAIAANPLMQVTLELGGKSPMLMDARTSVSGALKALFLKIRRSAVLTFAPCKGHVSNRSANAKANKRYEHLAQTNMQKHGACFEPFPHLP
ncbi:MAG: aldehyde dehydrogenase family protein [Polaromonas sp.]